MKNIILSFGLFFLFTLSKAQNVETKKADCLYNRFDYSKAINEYLKLVNLNKADAYVYNQLGNAYFFMSKNDEAVKYLKLALSLSPDIELHYKLAKVLKESGRMKEFIMQMDSFCKNYNNDKRAISFIENRNFYLNPEVSESRVKIAPVDFSSNYNDFGAILFNNEIYFTSNRPERKKNRINRMTSQPFNKIFVVKFENGKESDSIEEVHSLNSRTHDGPATFTADNKTSYISSSSYNINEFVRKRKNKFKGKNYAKMTLFKVTLIEEGFWSNFEILPFCDKDFTYESPVLSPDDKKLYFASDMPGGYGGLDIWSVNILNDGNFDEPVNLGPNVNTEFDESYPFISQDLSTLFFASKGHFGLGGYDIFTVPLNDLQIIQNLGKPFNSEKDDFSYVYYQEEDLTFFSSNRTGTINIYKTIPTSEEELLAEFNPESIVPLEIADFNFLDDGLMNDESYNSNGKVTIYIDDEKEYKVHVEIEGKQSGSDIFKRIKLGKKTVKIIFNKK